LRLTKILSRKTVENNWTVAGDIKTLL